MSSGFGSTGFGMSSGFGGRQSSMGSSGLFGSSSMFGTRTQQSGGFIGVDTQDVRNVMQTMGGTPSSSQSSRTTRTGLTQPGTTRRPTQGYSTQNQRARSSTRSGYGSRQSEIRTVVRVGFDYTPPPPAQLGSTVAARLEDCTRIRLRSPVEVSMEGTTAVLRGVVATEHDRVMAEQLARLEPGIWKVQNELTVAPPPAVPEEEPENR
jgi:osmotically-inducible protein OsmY